MAIDGRDIARLQQEQKTEVDGYDSPVARVMGFVIVAVPLVLLGTASYWVGTWDIAGFKGGVVGGVISVVLTLGTVAFIWFAKRGKKGRR